MRAGVKSFLYWSLLWVTFSGALVCASVDELNVRFRTFDFQGEVSLGVQDVIFQDSFGFIWFGGENGLVRFDGYKLKVFRHVSGKPGGISNNSVHGIAEDQQGNLWVATERGLNRFNRKTQDFSVFLHDPEDPRSLSYDVTRDVIVTRDGKVVVATFGGGLSVLDTSSGYFQSYVHDKLDPKSVPDNVIWTVMEDLDGYLWAGTNGAGAFRFNIKSGEVLRYNTMRLAAFKIAHDTVRAITQDSKGHMWLGTDGGVHRLDAFGAVKQHWQYEPGSSNSLGGNFVWDITEDAAGMIWVATDGGGLSLIDPLRSKVRRFQHTPLDPTTISSNVVRSVLEDRAGDIWTVHYPAGVSVFYRSAERVKQYRHVASNAETLSNSSVLSFLEDKKGGLWIGTDGGGLNRLQAGAQNFEHWQRGDDANSLSANAVLSLAQTEAGAIWVGTWGGGLNRFEYENGHFKRYGVNTQNVNSLQNANVWALLVDKEQQLWLGTEGAGLARYNAEQDGFVNYPHGRDSADSVVGSVVWALHEDLQGNIWVGTDAGLSRLDNATQQFSHFQFRADDATSLSDNGVLSLFNDHEGTLWVGTRAGLNRFDKASQNFQRVTVENGLASDSISSILQDREGFLWLGTGSGLSRYNPESGEIFNYHQSSWAWGKFNYGAALRRDTGELLFGGVNGFVSFFPIQLQRNTYVPPLHFTDFQVFNKSQEVGAKNSLLTQSLAFTEHITLDYWQSVFSFEFTALNYHGAEANQYAFMLEGFDRDWNYVGAQRQATYTNLSAGNYVFKVKASNNEGLWSETPLEMSITILPKPWLTWWAYTLYVSLLAFGIWFYVQSQRREIAREREVNERLRQLDKVKDNFLANTSHELRTPLNGIIGLTDSLVEGAAGPVGENMKYNLQMISNSGKRLASLVNDILDFSRLKNQVISINKEPVHLRSVTESVVTICRPLIGPKELDLSNNVEENLPAVLADENRLQQMLYNLIGNAIKFTDSGNIEVYAEQKGNCIWVYVKDSGVGIAANKMDRIFDSFEQGEDHENRNYTGAGLGLSITKQLVELHGGELKAESTPGQGSVFSFSLERAEHASPNIEANTPGFSHCLVDLDEDGEDELGSNYSERISGIDRMLVKENQKFKILIVDDEPVNRQVLINQLSMQGYQLREATNGREALDYISNESGFNLVLLDIMMPGMSGYEVCTRIRRQYSMNELPIIFLTAKNLISDLVDGFDMGANDFLTKPLAKGELVSRVRTHMQLLDVHSNLEERVKERTHEVERANQVLETLDGIVATINKEVILERLLDVLLREASRLFTATERSVYWSYSERFDRFTPIASNGFHPTELQQVYMPRDAMCRRYCVDSERITNDIYLVRPNAHTAGNQELMSLPRPKSILALAIHFDDSIIGFIALLNYHDSEAFNSLERQTLLRFFAHAKSALLKARLMQSLKLQNQKLEDAGLIDSLTGLRNRRYLHKYLDSDIALTLRSHRNRVPGTAIPPNSDLVFFMMDVDKFKATNNAYGQAAGDRFLIEIKQAMESVFRKSDFLLRWGGDKFLVVARFSNRNAAPVLAERMRMAVEQCEFDMGEDVISRQSCTIGFACFPFLVSDPLAFSWSQVLDIADMAMSVGKKNGRNCWVGIDAHIENENDLIFQNILAIPESLVNQKKLVLRTNLPPNMPVQW